MILGTTVLLCLLSAWLGWMLRSQLLLVGAVPGTCYVLLRTTALGRTRRRRSIAKPCVAAPPPLPAAARQPVDPDDTDGLVEQMLAQGRFALLLRRQLVGNLDEAVFRRTIQTLEKHMALVPDGEVMLGCADANDDDGNPGAHEIAGAAGRVIAVERFFLDRYPVSNLDYFEFVAGGGYEQSSLWEASILPAVLGFVDRTGAPGPHFWRDGCFQPGEGNHPVVGISWYEANAYARWLGKRLPSDAEWVKAGSWPVAPTPGTREQRRYPWGDTMDRLRANLWGSEPGGIVAVDEFPGGVSVGGVHQLIGNAWEWTSGDFRGTGDGQHAFDSPTRMKSIHGGAFDTYFDSQATCQFQSGENPLGRKHNISFRCAVSVCDLVLKRPALAPKDPDVHDAPGASPEPTPDEAHP